jgi:hypothetical protein
MIAIAAVTLYGSASDFDGTLRATKWQASSFYGLI